MSERRYPKDDEFTMHLLSTNLSTLQDLIDAAEAKWGNYIDLSTINIESEEIQVASFGYDLYDSSDYEDYIILTKVF